MIGADRGNVRAVDELETDEQGRPEAPHEGSEVETLRGYLAFQRATLEWKTRGLSDEQLRVALPPASMTLGGMLKHLAFVEDYWFTRVVGGQPAPEPWASADLNADPDWDWNSAASDSGDDLRALWAERVQWSEAVVASALGQAETAALNQAHPARGGQIHVSLRWVFLRMIEEYARHNGHADLIRESIDGQTGE
jgi:hypothetical protein